MAGPIPQGAARSDPPIYLRGCPGMQLSLCHRDGKAQTGEVTGKVTQRVAEGGACV